MQYQLLIMHCHNQIYKLQNYFIITILEIHACIHFYAHVVNEANKPLYQIMITCSSLTLN